MIPLAIASRLVQAKADNALAYGRCLWVVQTDAQALLDGILANWARCLLGADAWRCGAVARGELGWKLSGAARAVWEAAKKRARLWCLPASDIFRGFFARGHQCICSWATASLSTLQLWGVLDWPLWQEMHTNGTVQAYGAYVHDTLVHKCQVKWHAEASRHQLPVPYVTLFQAPSGHLEAALCSQVPFQCLVHKRAISRLRAGLHCFGQNENHRSLAAVRSCVFCGHRSRVFSDMLYSNVRPSRHFVPICRPVVAWTLMPVTNFSLHSWRLPRRSLFYRCCLSCQLH